MILLYLVAAESFRMQRNCASKLTGAGLHSISVGATTSSWRRSRCRPICKPWRIATSPFLSKASSTTCRILGRPGREQQTCHCIWTAVFIIGPWLNDALTGQVKLELSHHEQDSEGNFKSAKALVFVLDQLPDDQSMTKKEKKKSKQSAPTARNFGAFLSIPTLKDAENLCIAWRCRLLCSSWYEIRAETGFDLFFRNEGLASVTVIQCNLRLDVSASNAKGAKTIMPIRPVMCLRHQLEVNNETVCLVWPTFLSWG